MTESQDVIARLGGETYTFKFGDREYKLNPSEDLPINDADLITEFSKQASLYAYVAILTAKADAEAKLAKVELEEEEARTSQKVRAAFDAEDKKTTESMINSKVSVEPDVMIKKRILLRTQANHALLKALEESFKMRSDMLIRIGTMQQAEWNQIDRGDRIKGNGNAPYSNPSALAKQILSKQQGERNAAITQPVKTKPEDMTIEEAKKRVAAIRARDEARALEIEAKVKLEVEAYKAKKSGNGWNNQQEKPANEPISHLQIEPDEFPPD